MSDLLTAGGLERFGAVAAAHVGDEKVPGLVALVARGDQVHVEALGSLSIGGPPVRRDSLFRIASTTKPVTGAATLALVRDGLFSLDERVDGLLPELASPRVLRRMDGPLDETVPATRPITVCDLLTFTFGFGMVMDMFTAPEPWPVVAAATVLRLSTIGPPNPAEQPDPDTWIHALGSLPLLSAGRGRAAGLGPARGPVEPTANVRRRGAGLVSTADDLLAFARMLLRGGCHW